MYPITRRAIQSVFQSACILQHDTSILTKTWKNASKRCWPLLKVFYRSYSDRIVFERTKQHCNVGTIGHHGHGKTTLAAAITKVLQKDGLTDLKGIEDIDSSQHEKTRKMSINLAHVEFNTVNRHYALTDCPGHVDYIKTMITGASQMDGAILVVSATDGVMAQTREHLLIIKHLGVQNLVVFINKVEASDEEMVGLVELDTRDVLNEMGYDGENVAVVKGSALSALEENNAELGENSIWSLLSALDQIPTPQRCCELPFYLPIEVVYSITGRGTIVAGRLERGKLKKGDECELYGYGSKPIRTTMTEIRTFYKILDEAVAGDYMTALVRGVDRADVCHGMAACTPGTGHVADHLEVLVRVLEKDGRDRPLAAYERCEVFSRSWMCAAQTFLPDGETANSGRDALLTLKLFKPMSVLEGDRVVIRISSQTVATGVVNKCLQNLSNKDRSLLRAGKRI